jgi:hypothetical protein
VAIVPAYRIYFIGRNRISRPAKVIECTGDQEAIQKAKQFVDGHDVELWDGRRLVMRCPRDPK